MKKYDNYQTRPKLPQYVNTTNFEFSHLNKKVRSYKREVQRQFQSNKRRSASLCSLHSFKGKNLLENHAKRLNVDKNILIKNLKYDSRKTPFDEPSSKNIRRNNINFKEQINDIIRIKAKKKIEWQKFESLCDQSLSIYLQEKEERKEQFRRKQEQRKKSNTRQSSARTYLHSRSQSRPPSRVCVEAWSEMGKLTKENLFTQTKDRADTVDSIKSRHQNWSTESGTQDPLDIGSRPLEVDITPWKSSLLDKTVDFSPGPSSHEDMYFSKQNERMKDLIQIENIKTMFTNHGMYISRSQLERGLLVPDCEPIARKTKRLPPSGSGLIKHPFDTNRLVEIKGNKKKSKKKKGGKKKKKKK